MIDLLTNDQIDHVLNSQLVGRIGCHAEGQTYIVPVAYAYDGKYIYVHSRQGRKINMMRKNPRVCFQVDVIDNLANWRSVVINGEYEELTTKALQEKAYNLLRARLAPFNTSDASRPIQAPPPGEKKLRLVYYRIAVLEKGGRFEKQ